MGVLESVMQEDKLDLECAAKEYLRRLSGICTSSLSYYNRVIASSQFALPVLGYLMWTLQWPIMEFKQIDGEARKSVGKVRCRFCGKAPENVAHVLSGCSALAQSKYLSRDDAALKVLFYEVLHDLGLIDEVPPWYAPDKPKPIYESDNIQAYGRKRPIYAEHQEVISNRMDS